MALAWSLAKKLLQHERAAMSKFTEGGAPSHDALKTALPYMVDEQGRISDGVLREKLAGLLMDAQSFALTHRRVTEKALARQDVAGPSSIMKLVQTEQEVAKYELLEQVLGLRGLVFKSHGSADAMAFEHALNRAYDAARNNLLDRVRSRIAAAAPLLLAAQTESGTSAP